MIEGVVTDTMVFGKALKSSLNFQKNDVFLWLMILFSATAVTMSDFILPWGGANVAYELAMLLSMIALAYIQHRFPAKAWRMAVVGACFSAVSALLFQVASFAGALLLLRLGLAALFVNALGRAGVMVGCSRSYFPFTSCALLSYGFIATLQQFEITRLHFAGACAACSGLAALFAALSRNPTPCEGNKQAEPVRQQADGPLPGAVVALLAALLTVSQLFNSLDMYIFRQLARACAADDGAVFPACVALIGISYVVGGGIAKKRGIPVLFVASCTFSQLFLLLMLICGDTMLGGLISPLYVLSSAGIDLCIILLPTALRSRWPLPLPPLAAGVILFRAFKLYLLPSLLPDQWGWEAGNQLVFILAILAAMCQMLVVIYLVILKKNLRIAKLKEMIAAAEAPRSAPPPVPFAMTAREREVMALLLAGKSRGEIADCLGISFSTVNKHCVSIYRKAECSSHLELLSKYGYAPADTPGNPLCGTA